jgi:hypothetical protein
MFSPSRRVCVEAAEVALDLMVIHSSVLAGLGSRCVCTVLADGKYYFILYR